MNRALVWRTIQNSTWLLGGLILLGTAFFLWIGIQVHQRIVVEKPLDQGDIAVQPEKVRFSSTLGMMTDIVPPLDLSQSNDTSIHTAEFRGADYIKAQANRWYLHVMNVTKPEVIKTYLASRTDRQQFKYFRYLEPHQPERYILVYGSFATVTQALDASKTVKFDLPASVKVYPQRFSEIKKFVNDEVAADLKITNLGGANKLYQVKLRAVPMPVEQPASWPSRTSETNPGNLYGQASGTALNPSGLANAGRTDTVGQANPIQPNSAQTNLAQNNVLQDHSAQSNSSQITPPQNNSVRNNAVQSNSVQNNTAQNSAKPNGASNVANPANTNMKNNAGSKTNISQSGAANRPAGNPSPNNSMSNSMSNSAAEPVVQTAPSPEKPRPIADPFN